LIFILSGDVFVHKVTVAFAVFPSASAANAVNVFAFVLFGIIFNVALRFTADPKDIGFSLEAFTR
ncbi:hypothetical protein DRN80_04765, partial [Methanosarcinales archaeon]